MGAPPGVDPRGLPLGVSLGGSSGLVTVSRARSDLHGFDRLEERLGGLLLTFGRGKTLHSSAGFVHVTAELVNDIEPLLLGNVTIELSETLLGLGKNCLFLGSVLRVAWVVDGAGSVTVYRVGRIEWGGLIASISGTLRVTGTVSNKTEHGETWRLTDSSVGNDRDESGTSSDLSKGLAAGLL
jgi:hypothetical protein